MNLENKLRWIFGAALVCLATSMGVFASPNSAADLEVEMRGANRQFVYSPYVYRARVRNIGGTRAENVKVTIDLPESANSPRPYVLGRISSIDNKCTLVNNKLECDLGRIRPGKRKNAKFTFVMPVSTRTLEFTATATADVDSNPNNNADTKVLRPKYSNLIINGPVNVINQQHWKPDCFMNVSSLRLR